MDDIKPANAPNSDGNSTFPRPSGGQVMDIQSSKPGTPMDSAPILPESSAEAEGLVTEGTATEEVMDTMAEAPPTESTDTHEPANVEEPSADTSSPVQEASVLAETTSEAPAPTNIDVTRMDEAPATERPAPSVADEASAPASTDPKLMGVPPVAPKATSGKPTLVILVAVVVALALSGLVIYTFMKTKKDTTGTAKSVNSTSTQTAVKPLASPADVDATNKEIETSLNKVNDSTDFSGSDLSDKSLGL